LACYVLFVCVVLVWPGGGVALSGGLPLAPWPVARPPLVREGPAMVRSHPPPSSCHMSSPMSLTSHQPAYCRTSPQQILMKKVRSYLSATWKPSMHYVNCHYLFWIWCSWPPNFLFHESFQLWFSENQLRFLFAFFRLFMYWFWRSSTI